VLGLVLSGVPLVPAVLLPVAEEVLSLVLLLPVEPALSGEGAVVDELLPAVPLPVISLVLGVVAAVEDALELSTELAGGVVDTLVSLRREHAATEPASATAISATSIGFAELRSGRLTKIGFIIKPPI
jgi:hypothetical protein